MIYSIGYQKLTPAELLRVMKEKQIAYLIDCRSVPYGRRHEFNRKRLENLLGLAYHFMGDRLGGFIPIDPAAIEWLVSTQGVSKLLLCMEDDPRSCHRHYEIARRLHQYGITVTHLYQGAEISSQELEALK